MNIFLNIQENPQEIFIEIFQKILIYLQDLRKNNKIIEKLDKINEICPFDSFRKVLNLIKFEKKLLIKNYLDCCDIEMKKIYNEILSTNSIIIINPAENCEESKLRKIVQVKRKE